MIERHRSERKKITMLFTAIFKATWRGEMRRLEFRFVDERSDNQTHDDDDDDDDDGNDNKSELTPMRMAPFLARLSSAFGKAVTNESVKITYKDTEGDTVAMSSDSELRALLHSAAHKFARDKVNANDNRGAGWSATDQSSPVPVIRVTLQRKRRPSSSSSAAAAAAAAAAATTSRGRYRASGDENDNDVGRRRRRGARLYSNRQVRKRRSSNSVGGGDGLALLTAAATGGAVANNSAHVRGDDPHVRANAQIELLRQLLAAATNTPPPIVQLTPSVLPGNAVDLDTLDSFRNLKLDDEDSE
jgi:PB1 domain